jgi:hypothetical protein
MSIFQEAGGKMAEIVAGCRRQAAKELPGKMEGIAPAGPGHEGRSASQRVNREQPEVI